MRDVNEKARRTEVASLCITNLLLNLEMVTSHTNLSIAIGDLQLDNQTFDQGGFDFSVVFISQDSAKIKEYLRLCNYRLENINVSDFKSNALITIDCGWDVENASRGEYKTFKF